MTPTPDAEVVGACEHAVIQTWRTEDGVVRLWACADCRLRFHPATLARSLEREALVALALKWATHSGSCCTFDAEGAVIVTPESCRCHEPERTAQRLLGMYGKPGEYRAAIEGGR